MCEYVSVLYTNTHALSIYVTSSVLQLCGCITTESREPHIPRYLGHISKHSKVELLML